MRVAMITAQLSGGGAEKMVYKLSSGLKRSGVKVTVIAAGGEYGRRLNEEGVEVSCLPLNRKFSWRMGIALGRELAAREFDIIHVHTVPLALWVKAWLWKQRRSIPVVLTLHGSPIWKLNIVKPCLSRMKLKYCAVSRELAHVYKADYIPNGVDNLNSAQMEMVSLRKCEAGKAIKAVIVARLVHEKGIDRWLHAVARLRQKGISIETWVLGEGPQRSALERLSRELSLSTYFLGWLPEPGEVMQGMELFVLPSRREGEPLALLEAMGLGLPIVATRVGGVADLLVGGAGLLTESSIDGLVTGCEQFLALGPKRLENMRKHARQRAAEHTWAQCIGSYYSIYSQEIDQYGKRA